MRTITDPTTGVTINYPDALAFAFNPFLVEGVGVDELEVIITLNGQIKYTISAQAFNRTAYIDIQEYLQSLFDDMSLALDYSARMAESAQGLQVSISVTATSGEDDFGTGFASVAVLKELECEVVKIDRMLVKDVALDRREEKLAAAVTELSSVYDANTCIEGIETSEMAELLRKYPVKTFQGYYYSKPVPIREFKEKIQQSLKIIIGTRFAKN